MLTYNCEERERVRGEQPHATPPHCPTTREKPAPNATTQRNHPTPSPKHPSSGTHHPSDTPLKDSKHDVLLVKRGNRQQ